jgi:hypothetical protein
MNKTIEVERILADRVWKLFGQTRSSRARTGAVAVVALTAAISVLVAALALPSKIMADDDEFRTFTIDVATDGLNANFQNNVNPSQAPDAFFPGDTFLLRSHHLPGWYAPERKS